MELAAVEDVVLTQSGLTESAALLPEDSEQADKRFVAEVELKGLVHEGLLTINVQCCTVYGQVI